MKSNLIFLLSLFVFGCSRDDNNTIVASGTIEGTDVTIAAEVGGRVKERRVDEGSRVDKGDTLLVIDDTDFQLQLRQARANQEATEAQYKLALEGTRKEDILQAEAAFNNAEQDYLRMKELLPSHAVTQKQFDDTYARYVAAQQTFEKLKHGSRREEINAARARSDQAAVQVEQLQKKIRDCHLLSPSSGVISLKSVEPGELVTVGANLLRVTYLDKVKLTIYISETELGRVRLGQKASVNIDTYRDRSFEGTVIYVSQIAEFTPRNVQTKEERAKLVFAVKIQIANPEGILKPGMPADATLHSQ